MAILALFQKMVKKAFSPFLHRGWPKKAFLRENRFSKVSNRVFWADFGLERAFSQQFEAFGFGGLTSHPLDPAVEIFENFGKNF